MPPKNPTVDLKRKYQRMFEVGIIVSIAFVILAFRFFPKIETQTFIEEEKKDWVNIEDVERTSQIQKPPAPPKPPIPVESPSDDDLEDIEIDGNELDASANITKTNVKFIEEIDSTPDFKVFFALEDMPRLIGGIAEIQKKVIYPEIAVRASVQGKVYVKAIVKKNGNLDSVHVVKGIGAGCDEASLRAVRDSKFIPGTQRGKPVNCWISIPIKFQLN